MELDTITDYLAALPLSGPERKLLDLAATFRGSFPRSWLAELACATGTAIADEALARLSGQQLLLAQQDGAMIRVPVRLQRHLSEQPATEAVKQWHARAAELRRERGDFVESMWHLLQAGCYVQIADSIQGRINTLNISGLRALQEILGRVPDEGLTTVQRAWLYAGRGFCEIVCAPPGQIARVPADFARLQDLPETQAQVLLWLSMYYQSSDPKLALYYVDQVAQQFPPEHQEGRAARLHKGMTLNLLARHEEARDCVGVLVDIAAENDHYTQSNLHICLAESYQGLGDWERAMRHAETAHVHYQQLGNPFYTAHALRIIGYLKIKLNQFDDGLDLLRQALAEFRRLEYESSVLICQACIANALLTVGRLDEARAATEDVIGLARTGSPLAQSFHVHVFAAKFYLRAGDIDAAGTH